MIHTKIDQIASIHTKIQPTANIKTKVQPLAQIKTKTGIPEMIIVEPEIYTGQTVVVPSAYFEQELYTKDKLVKSNITVRKIPYYETTNDTGKTIYIGNEDLVIFEGGN